MNDEVKSSVPQMLIQTRVIWFAMLVTPIVMTSVALAMRPGHAATAQPSMPIMSYVCMAQLATLLPLGLFIRNQVYKANWRGDVVTPHGYMRGNLILMAMLEGTSMFAVVVIMMGEPVAIPLAVAFLAMAIHVVNFPNGKPMLPHKDPFRSSIPGRDDR